MFEQYILADEATLHDHFSFSRPFYILVTERECNINRVSQFLSPTRNWVPLPPPPLAIVSAPHLGPWGSHTRLRVGVEGHISDDGTETVELWYSMYITHSHNQSTTRHLNLV
jgi:hypothetical protein